MFIQNILSVSDVCCKCFDLDVLWARLAVSHGMPHRSSGAPNVRRTKQAPDIWQEMAAFCTARGAAPLACAKCGINQTHAACHGSVVASCGYETNTPYMFHKGMFQMFHVFSVLYCSKCFRVASC